MAPKADKGKGVKSAEAQRLAALRKERVIFSPQLGVQELREYFYLFWATETRAHPRTRVLPATASNLAPNGYPFGASSEAAAGSTLVRGCTRVSVAQKR